jgi:hypothetical protein
MRKSRLVAVIAAALMVGACGSGNGNDGPGGTGSPDAGGKINPPVQGITINAALGLDLVQHPDSIEGPVTGLVLVELDDEPLSGATVTINGAVLPEHSMIQGFYDAAQAEIPNALPGGKLELTASKDGKSATLTLDCPTEVTIIAPAENTPVAIGETVTMVWNGKIDYDNPVIKPTARINAWRTEENRISSTTEEGSFKKLTTETSVQLKVPDDYGDAFVAELSVPGSMVIANDNAGMCGLVRRVRLTRK